MYDNMYSILIYKYMYLYIFIYIMYTYTYVRLYKMLGAVEMIQ